MNVDPPGVHASALVGHLDAYLLDVRERVEWDAGHAPTAIHVPMATVAAAVIDLPPDTRILVVCRSGNRSRTVASALREVGIDAWNVEGGMQAWQQAGGLVVRPDGGTGSVI